MFDKETNIEKQKPDRDYVKIISDAYSKRKMIKPKAILIIGVATIATLGNAIKNYITNGDDMPGDNAVPTEQILHLNHGDSVKLNDQKRLDTLTAESRIMAPEGERLDKEHEKMDHEYDSIREITDLSSPKSVRIEDSEATIHGRLLDTVAEFADRQGANNDSINTIYEKHKYDGIIPSNLADTIEKKLKSGGAVHVDTKGIKPTKEKNPSPVTKS